MPWIGSESLSGICQRANELDSAKRDYPLPDIVLLDDRFPVRVVAAVGAGHHPSSSRSHFATFSGNLLSKSQQSENLATDDEQDREEGKFGSKSRERAKEKKTWQVANNWGKVGSKEIFSVTRWFAQNFAKFWGKVAKKVAKFFKNLEQPKKFAKNFATDIIRCRESLFYLFSNQTTYSYP